MSMEVYNFSTTRLLLSSSPVTLSVLLTSCCFFRSLMGQSPLLRKAHLLETGLSLIRSLMGQSPLFSKAHLPETGLSPIHAESHGSVSPVVKCSFARGRLLSDPESHESALSVVQCSFAGDGPLSNPGQLIFWAYLRLRLWQCSLCAHVQRGVVCC